VATEDIVHLSMRVADLERKVDHLLRYATDAPPLPPKTSDLSPRVQELIQAGDLIGAIKAYREETGVGLAVAKARVEQGL
jgi:ribosomal protein L7/L12